MHRVALVLLALAAPVLLGGCCSSTFRTKPQLSQMIVDETCEPLPYYHGP